VTLHTNILSMFRLLVQVIKTNTDYLGAKFNIYAYIILVWVCKGKKPHGKHQRRQGDNIKMVVKSIRCLKTAEGKIKCAVINFRVI
jgi:hypothetical protein